jgi:transposase
MPEAIVSRILRLPGYRVSACEADETAGALWVWVRQTTPEPYYVCGGCGISVRDVHGWTERRVRDLPWGTWQVWLVVEVHRAVSPLRGADRAATVRDGQGISAG